MTDFFTTELLIRLVTAALASAAFAIMFKTNKRHLIYIAICGALAYFIYYSVIYFKGSEFLAALISTIFAAIFSESCARILHAPAIIFVIPGVIAIFPGGNLYYTMSNFLEGNYEETFSQLLTTLSVGIGIAGGVVAVSVAFGIAFDINAKIKKMMNSKTE